MDETKGIVKTENGAAVEKEAGLVAINADAIASMNMWAMTPDFLDELAEGFPKFLAEIPEGDLKAEYLLPLVVDEMVQSGKASVKVIPTQDKWFGVTYAEDKPLVVEAIRRMTEEGLYPLGLWKK